VQNGIRMEGITVLAKGLAQNLRIQHIDLQDNTFAVDGVLTGVEAWTEALASWPELHTLNLSDCVLSADGEVPTLVEALAGGSNPKLRTLQLQNNNLEAATFAVLAQAISKGLKSLMTLELQWNDVEEDDENLENISLSLKQRGGKLFASDEEDEDSEAEKAEEDKVEEIEAVAEEEEAATKAETTTSPPAEQAKPKDSADDLADMFSKVGLQ